MPTDAGSLIFLLYYNFHSFVVDHVYTQQIRTATNLTIFDILLNTAAARVDDEIIFLATERATVRRLHREGISSDGIENVKTIVMLSNTRPEPLGMCQ